MKKNKRKKQIKEPDQDLIKAYSERIAELKKMNEDLAVALEEYRLKERKISDALAYAEEKKKEADREAKIRFSLECKRLAAFRKKWIFAVRNGTAKGDFEKTEQVLEECRRQLLSEFESEENSDFLEETERLEEKFSSPDQKRKIDCITERELEALLNQIPDNVR